MLKRYQTHQPSVLNNNNHTLLTYSHPFQYRNHFTMKFTTTTILTIVGLAAAAPSPQGPFQFNKIFPSVVSHYEVWTGAIKFNTGTGKVFKNGQTTDISTLLTFTYPLASVGKTCAINLSLGPASVQTGATEIDVFSSLAPAPGPRSSWGPGNQRNNHLGRIRVNKPGVGVYLAGFPVTGNSFPCPAAGTKVGFELVATDDKSNTVWVQSQFVGAFISYA
jgi:hypothetical protein